MAQMFSSLSVSLVRQRVHRRRGGEGTPIDLAQGAKKRGELGSGWRSSWSLCCCSGWAVACACIECCGSVRWGLGGKWSRMVKVAWGYGSWRARWMIGVCCCLACACC